MSIKVAIGAIAVAAGSAIFASGVKHRGDARAASQAAAPAPLTEEEKKAWWESAVQFDVNEDFDMTGVDLGRIFKDWSDKKPYAFQNAIRAESTAEKASLTAVEDKVLMHNVIDGIPGIKQLPHVFVYWEDEGVTDEAAEKLAAALYGLPFVIKPTHLSDSMGFKAFPRNHGITASVLKAALKTAATAPRKSVRDLDPESDAEVNVRSGAVMQPAYPAMDWFMEKVPTRDLYVTLPGPLGQPRDRVDMQLRKEWLTAPFELRVQVVWGRAYMIVLRMAEEGASMNMLGVTPQREKGTTTLSDAAEWPCQHTMNWNDRLKAFYEVQLGVKAKREMIARLSQRMPLESYAIMYDAEVQLLCDTIRPHMHSVVEQAEKVATSLQAPYLRVDFFVPPLFMLPRYPVVLNEVEYNQGLTYHKYSPDENVIAPPHMQAAVQQFPAGYEQFVEAGHRAQNELKVLLAKGWEARTKEDKQSQPRWHAFEKLGCKSSSSDADEPKAEYMSMSCERKGRPGKWWKETTFTQSTEWWDEAFTEIAMLSEEPIEEMKSYIEKLSRD